MFLGWRTIERWRQQSDFGLPLASTTPESRARCFMLIWLVFILGATSVLPVINDFFRIRWSILPLAPACILIAWPIHVFLEIRGRLPIWASVAAAILFAVQSGINLNRSLWHRRDLGQVMVSIDKAYRFVDKNYPADEFALWPGFLPYDYHPDASPAILHRDALARPDDLNIRHRPGRTTVIFWQPVLSPQIDVVQRYNGCNAGVLFEALVPCTGGGTVVMRYIAQDATFQSAVTSQSHGDLTQARQLLQQFLAQHPNNDGARLQLARVACQGHEWSACDRSLAELEVSYPDDARVLRDRAFALLQLKQYDRAIALLKRIVAADPNDIPTQVLLAQAYRFQGKTQDADKVIAALRDRLAWANARDPLASAEIQARQMPTPENFLNLSLQYHRAGRFQDCIAAAREALKLRPDYAEAWNNIAAGYQSMGRWDDAIAVAQEALRLKPDFELARNNLAWSMSQKAQRK